MASKISITRCCQSWVARLLPESGLPVNPPIRRARSRGNRARQYVLESFRPVNYSLATGGPGQSRAPAALGELRAGIEPIAAQLAAGRALPEHCGELTKAVIGISIAAKSGDMEAFLTADVEFHRTLLIASGN